MPFTTGKFKDSAVEDEIGFRVKGHEGDLPIIFMIARGTFTDCYAVKGNVWGAFEERWGQVQAACTLAYERWKGRKGGVAKKETRITVTRDDFQAD
jgi:hypothetical protein